MNAPYHIDSDYEHIVNGACLFEIPDMRVGFEMVEGDPLITEIWVEADRSVKREDGTISREWHYVLADPQLFALIVKGLGDKLDEYMTDKAVDFGATAEPLRTPGKRAGSNTSRSQTANARRTLACSGACNHSTNRATTCCNSSGPPLFSN